ncbi:MAG: glycoside hydrolase domain-containing protein [Tepidisphaerales bacterium]
MISRTLALLFLCCLLFTATAMATDVAFWSEYKSTGDDAVYGLIQFDREPLAGNTGIDIVAPIGNPRWIADGRFGGGLRLDGKSGLRCDMHSVFDGGQVSIEAWVKLAKYPVKEGYIVYRPAAVDQDPAYDPAVDVSKGFALAVDAQGALHLDIVNMFYGKRTRTSSKPGVVPLDRWVHVAGVCGPARRLYVDGHEVADVPIHWGEGLVVQGEKESKPQPVYIGSNEHGDMGIAGDVDQVRVHGNIQKFWPPEDTAWTDPQATRPVPSGPPHFVREHAPVANVPLDGGPETSGSAGAKVELGPGEFAPGVRGRAFAGRIAITAPKLFDSNEGSLEFWLRPQGVNSLSDRNRTFIGEPFNFYLFNSSTHEPTLYFGDAELGLHFIHTTAEFHPARWYHVLFTWLGPDIRIYIDGALAGHTFGRPLINHGRRTADRFVFNPSETVGLFDEIRIYNKALLPNEAANAYWRYRDASKLTADVRMPSVDIAGEYLPSHKTIFYQLTPRMPSAEFTETAFDLRGLDGTNIKTWTRPWTTPPAGELDLPELPDGKLSLGVAVKMRDGRSFAGSDFPLYSRRFPWENNTLGMSDEVFPPFEPVTTHEQAVSVVSRRMTMNGFGLWNQAESLGRELLAEPMTIRFETAAGPGIWKSAAGTFVSRHPTQALYESAAESDPVKITTRSSIEVDGCMKVTMILSPGAIPAEIRKLWLDIPLQSAEAPLMHTIGDGLRHNYSGATPAGEGIVWDGAKAARSEKWRNDFVPYIWLGAAERGLAFFAENDRGWITAKNHSKTPTHELRREGDRLTLRVYLINTPATLSQPREIVFGLQVSPTKPMPADWRTRLPHAPGGLAVVPWGGIQCASQGPYADDWSIVEKILDVRRSGKFDEAWLADYVAKHNPPKTHNESDWAYFTHHFAQRAKDVGMTRPLAVYQEEMRAAHSRPEWIAYQDEWKTSDGPAARTQPDGLDLAGGHRSFSDVSEITFPRSYADFGTWMADQWLKRGVSLYWDNTYLYPSRNTRTTAAYVAEDGYIQPALGIWNVREYHKRVWHLLQQRRKEHTEPLEWTLHMTNTLVLPVHTWGTVDLDHELAVKRPFSPGWLMTETIGRQVGNLPLSLYEVAGRDNEIVKALPQAQQQRIEWGLRAVHEIQHTGPQGKLLTAFGYGTPSVTVHNYWDDRPLLRVEPASVKWLALRKSATGELLIVLANWSQERVKASLQLTPASKFKATDAETGQPLDSATNTLEVDIPGPWGNRIIRVTP